MLKKTTLTALTLTALAFAVGCGDDDPESTTEGTGGSTATSSSTTGTGGAGGGGEAQGRVRVAHLSPDAPSVDFCVSPDGGTTWVGPVAENVLGVSDGLAYSGVTDYIPLPAATYDIRIVAPDATDCNTGLLPSDITGITLPADVDATLAATGFLAPEGTNPGFELTVFVDDNTTPEAGKGHLRFIHTSPDTPPVDVGLGQGAAFTPVFTNVAFRKTGEPTYLATDAFEGATISARATGTDSDALVLENVALPSGAIATAFAIGNLEGSPQPLKVLLCVDNAEKATCSVLP